jgi:nickel transport protein
MFHRCIARTAQAALLVLLLPVWAHGHALLHEVLDGEAVILSFAFPGGEQPWFEPYEVFAPGAETPFQSGRINAQGEMSFRPDRPGRWRVRVFTEDGHGAVIELEVDEAGRVDASRSHHPGMHGYWARVFAALGYLLGGFGLLVLWRSRRAPRVSTG